MGARQPADLRRARANRVRAATLTRPSLPGAMAAALAAAAVAFGLLGCAGQDLSSGGGIEPGVERVHAVGRGGASTACRHAATRAAALGTSGSTASVARCAVVGATLVCTEEPIS